MSNEEAPKWRQYEWLISKIFHDEYSSLDTKVIYDARIAGQYSERSRQIDILVKANSVKTIVECKDYSKPVDLKGVESFLGMFSDVKADFGILISSSGFTKSAKNRIRELSVLISLEHLDWETAYTTSFEEQSYGRISDLCSCCFNKHELGKSVPGLLCWEHGFGVEIEGKISQFSVAKCLKCSNHSVYCDCCGRTTADEEACCRLSSMFMSCYLDNQKLKNFN